MQFSSCSRADNYTSRPSVHSETAYDYATALRRLQSLITADMITISAAEAAAEELRGVPAAASSLFFFVRYSGDLFQRDRYSTSLVHRFLGIHGAPFTAAEVQADGSCLFYAASKRLTGNLSFAIELRLRTCLELIYNRQMYLTHPMAEKFNLLSSTYNESVIDCTKCDGYSSMWTVLALSSVLRRRITSFYPYINGPADPYAEIGNITAYPLHDELYGEESLYILWTRTTSAISSTWRPNHVVLLYEDEYSAAPVAREAVTPPTPAIRKTAPRTSSPVSTNDHWPSISTLPIPAPRASSVLTDDHQPSISTLPIPAPRASSVLTDDHQPSISTLPIPAPRTSASEISSEASVKVIKSNKGNSKICFRGYMYNKKHAGKCEITWHCCKQSSTQCLGTLKTSLDMTCPLEVACHCHGASEDLISVAECHQEMKHRAQTSLDKPNQILTTAVAVLPESVSALLPPSESSRRLLRLVRSKNRPHDPKTLEELVVTGKWALTAGVDPRPFLLYDNGKEATEHLLIFSTAEHLEFLGHSTSLFMDGTFGVAPAIFGQLYVIHGQVGTTTCPLLYALLQRQTQASYERLLQFIVDSSSARPLYINVDFEKAVHLAIRSVFGYQVIIRGCFYHLTQSTWRKIQNLGLTDLYTSNDEFCLFCGQLDALALLPLPEVFQGMAHIRRTMPTEALDLVEYFDSTYVSGPLRRRPMCNGTVGVRLQRQNPIFPPKDWNCHDSTLIGDARTNNISEGWNNRFAHLVGRDNPSVWKLIEDLQKEAQSVYMLIVQDARGVRPAKRVPKNQEQLQMRLKNLCDDIVNGRNDVAQFLLGVSHNIRSGQPYM